MPPGAIYVGRPTKWGNPYILKRDGTAEQCVKYYRLRMKGLILIKAIDIELLRGKDLACWCPLDEPCHADVLLELANS